MATAADIRPIDALASRLGYEFRDPEELRRALTHRSAVPGDRVAHESYQRHEFLGDRVLALVVASMLYADDPRAAEGDLARRLNQLVRRETCAEVAGSLDVGSARGNASPVAAATRRSSAT
jgi:ribonuclease-3